MTLYEITNDVLQINELLESAVDSDGNPRDLTPEEENTIREWFAASKEDFEAKFDSYGKFITNLKLQAETADGERKAYKEELDRLSARAKSYDNRRRSVLGGLRYAMEKLGLEKYKTSLFSAGIQNTALKIEQTGRLKDIPEKYLKPRELNASAVKDGIKSGELIKTDGGSILLAATGELLEGIRAEQGKTLVMR